MGYDRIVGALANLGHEVSDQTVGNVLRRHGIPPAPERKRRSTWAEFIRIHLALLAGTDISAAEVLMRGLVACYVLFFIYLESSRIDISRITNCPDKPWKLRVTLEPVAGFLVDAVERDTFRTRRRWIERDRAGHERQFEVTLPVGARGHGKLLTRETPLGRPQSPSAPSHGDDTPSLINELASDPTYVPSRPDSAQVCRMQVQVSTCLNKPRTRA